jgi:uncharacterized membrane protein
MNFQHIARYMWWIRLAVFLYLLLIACATTHFQFFILNFTLAYIPFEVAFFIYRHSFFRNHLLFIPLSALWLLFYPNAPYAITDYFHLSVLDYKTSVPDLIEGGTYSIFSANSVVWYHFMVMTFSVFACLTVGFVSLGVMVKLLTDRFRAVPPMIWVSVITCLSSYAIYIGRFTRLHSMDLIFYPTSTIEQMMGAVAEPNFWSFVLMITCVQLILIFVWRHWIFVKNQV